MMGTKAILQLNSFIEVLEFRIPQGILNNQKTAEGTGHRQMSHRPCPESGPLAAGPSPPLLLNQLPAEVSRGGTKPVHPIHISTCCYNLGHPSLYLLEVLPQQRCLKSSLLGEQALGTEGKEQWLGPSHRTYI